jgi:hypothetical protein
MEMLDRVRKWIMQLTEVGLALIALGIVLQLLFGKAVAFVTGDVTGNIIALVGQLGANGVVGLIAIAIILYLFSRKT